MSKIEWTEKTWNPVTGCTKISEGCRNCYAERMAKRLFAMGSPKYEGHFKVRCHEDQLEIPLKIKKPTMFFVCSMGDLFHEDVKPYFVRQVFDTMKKAKQHTFQVLTKRPFNASVFSDLYEIPNNVWMGTSIENEATLERVEHLLNIEARVRFLSIEPLLEPLPNLNLSGIDWVIVGGESGPGARPMKEEWVLPIREQCLEKRIPFFFKQWGGTNKKKSGRLLEGREWNMMPKGFEK